MRVSLFRTRILAAMLLVTSATATTFAANPRAVPDYYRTDYGRRIGAIDGKTLVWWCDATHKIAIARPVPAAVAPAATMDAARHDYEAVQIVVTPSEALKGLMATAGSLSGPEGAEISAKNMKILRVYYHFVDRPTDRTGVRDWWPDALPPLEEPLDVAAGHNQPLWVLVYVPKDAKPGDYVGSVSLKADGFSATVPLKLHVWNFALPEKNHLETDYALIRSEVFREHRLKTEADKRRVWELYWQSFADHRISPAEPVPFDPIRVKYLPEANPPRAEVDFSAFDHETARVLEKFHFTNFQVDIDGFHNGRHLGKIGKYTPDTPQYRAMIASYLRQVEDHLREKGWLNMAYFDWFDEPETHQYEYVARWMQFLRTHAPGVARILTEEPSAAFLKHDPAISIWCPVSDLYNHFDADKRRAAGERLWWYICCSPKAPYCTEFIDHPATELRVWHWQTWQRNIVGTLLWGVNYWTSPVDFPDPKHPQDPYRDPMSYGTDPDAPSKKKYWGNGDGRFLYPPLASRDASRTDPIIEPPVSSIRWEMIREGVEDYEMLYMLRDLLASRRAGLAAQEVARIEGLLKVPASITTDVRTFTKDPAPIYVQRALIAAAIERLSSGDAVLSECR